MVQETTVECTVKLNSNVNKPKKIACMRNNLFILQKSWLYSLGVYEVELKGSMKEILTLLEEELWMEGGQDESSQHLAPLQQRCYTTEVSERSPYRIFV